MQSSHLWVHLRQMNASKYAKKVTLKEQIADLQKQEERVEIAVVPLEGGIFWDDDDGAEKKACQMANMASLVATAARRNTEVTAIMRDALLATEVNGTYRKAFEVGIYTFRTPSELVETILAGGHRAQLGIAETGWKTAVAQGEGLTSAVEISGTFTYRSCGCTRWGCRATLLGRVLR